MVSVAFLYLCFTGTMFLNSLIMTTNHYPLLVAGLRIFGSGIILLGYSWSVHKGKLSVQLRQLINFLFIKYTFFLYFFSAIGFSWGMQYIDPVKACFLFVLAPFITALMLYFWYKESLSYKKILGLIIGFCAVVPIVFQSSHGQLTHVPWILSLWGYLVFFAAIVSFAYGWIVSRELQAQVHVSSQLITGAALTTGGAMILLLTGLLYRVYPLHIQVTADFWWLVLLFAILTAVAYNLYASLLHRFSPTFISFASFLEPAFGMIYAYFAFGQQIGTLSLVSLAILSAGLYIFYQEELSYRQ